MNPNFSSSKQASKLRIFVISCVFPPEPVTSAFTSAEVAEEMVRRGHEVVVFAPFPNRPVGKLMNCRKRQWKQAGYKDGYKIIHSWHTLSEKSSFFSRTLENISFGLTSTWQIFRERIPDVVYMNTWPLFSQNFNSLLLKHLNVPIFCSVQDIYPESSIGKGMIKAESLLSNIIRYIDRKHFSRCTTITSISPSMVELLTKDRGIASSKVFLIPNWMDESKFPTDLPRSGSFRKKHGISSEVFLAIFAGSLTMSAGVELYVKAAEVLTNRSDIFILLVGDGTMRKSLEEEIAFKNLDNIHVISPLKQEDVPGVHAAANILLMSLAGEMSHSAAPSKQIAYMLSGRPIAASISPGNFSAQIIKEANAGFILPPDDPYAVADLLIKLAENPEPLDQMGINAREYAKAHFSKQVVLPYLASILEEAAATPIMSGYKNI